jgi:hypothetical protein
MHSLKLRGWPFKSFNLSLENKTGFSPSFQFDPNIRIAKMFLFLFPKSETCKEYRHIDRKLLIEAILVIDHVTLNFSVSVDGKDVIVSL